jgi:hypothetical protein
MYIIISIQYGILQQMYTKVIMVTVTVAFDFLAPGSGAEGLRFLEISGVDRGVR